MAGIHFFFSFNYKSKARSLRKYRTQTYTVKSQNVLLSIPSHSPSHSSQKLQALLMCSFSFLPNPCPRKTTLILFSLYHSSVSSKIVPRAVYRAVSSWPPVPVPCSLLLDRQLPESREAAYLLRPSAQGRTRPVASRTPPIISQSDPNWPVSPAHCPPSPQTCPYPLLIMVLHATILGQS